uniref:Integrator complex subunit 4 n=1 Tax=Ascaris suum TaxID=6253 RepID=F1KTK7_ASCSU
MYLPKKSVEDEQASIIPTGACGALITALEDEFMVVRQAGVYSLGRLAADRSFLAAAAIDNLSDMFNDEIEEVRLDAIYALTPLVVHGVLHKEQLDTMLTVLDDASPDSREALRVLLMKATMDSPECMEDSVRALLNCLRRFPIDESSIFRCLGDLGRRHGSFVQPLVVGLLGLNPMFEITEPELDDSTYMAKLMLILNAASVHDPLCSLLPEFVVRHYRYLRSSMPDLIPFVKKLSDGEMADVDDTSRITKKKAVRRETLSLLESLYEKICDACGMDSYKERTAMLKRLVSDFDGLCIADSSIAGTARFVANLIRLLMHYDLVLQKLSCFGDFESVLSVVDEGLEMVEHGESEFCSVDTALLGLLAEYRFRLRVLRVAAQLDIDPRAYVNVSEVLSSEIDSLKERLTALDMVPTAATAVIMAKIAEQVDQSVEKKFVGGRGIVAAFQPGGLTPPEKLASFSTIATKWVEIVEPTEAFKDPIRFRAGLPLGVLFNILLHNFNEEDVENFRIKIAYSTQRYVLFRPRKTDMKSVPMQAHRFLGHVLIESNVWSTAGVVRISCVLLIPQRKQVCLERGNHTDRPFGRRNESTATKYVSLLESPFSSKLAYQDIPIYPMSICSL